MRVLVCGGRDYDRSACVYSALDELLREHGAVTVIEGGATGADRIAASWTANPGSEGRVELRTYHADWAGQGKAAGMIRNRRMLVDGKPDLVLAFPGGKGTANMVRLARKAGVEVRALDHPSTRRTQDA